MAFEIEGDLHYFDINYYGQYVQTLNVDVLKAFICGLVHRITLIEVPYYAIDNRKSFPFNSATIQTVLTHVQAHG